MFTGLVADLGTVQAAVRSPQGAHLTISTPLAAHLHEGDSIAVNGVCLTATAVRDSTFDAEAMHVTLTTTALGSLAPGAAVNLELPLRADERFGGHIVQGHVDGVGTVSEIVQDGFARRVRIDASDNVLRYVVEHGSIAVNGVSLTVAALATQSFTVSLIPETLERTNLGSAQPGAPVNLEVDVWRNMWRRRCRGWPEARGRRGEHHADTPLRHDQEAIEEISAGRWSSSATTRDRENEGDLMMAAQFVDARGDQLHAQGRRAG